MFLLGFVAIFTSSIVSPIIVMYSFPTAWSHHHHLVTVSTHETCGSRAQKTAENIVKQAPTCCC